MAGTARSRPEGFPAARTGRRSPPSFFAFRIMVGIGLLLIAAGLAGVVLWWRGRLFESALVPSPCRSMPGRSASSPSSPAGSSTESGRQPWLVLRPAAHRRRHLAGAGRERRRHARALRRRLRRRVRDRHLLHQPPDRRGPQDAAIEPRPHGVPNRPISAAEEATREATRPSRAATGPGRLTSRTGGVSRWNGIFRVIWAALIGTAVAMYVILDGFDLGIGILFPFARDGGGPRRDDELRRAVLGRQRDLAGARRRRSVGGVSAGLRGHHAGLLPAGDRHAAGARSSAASRSSSAGWRSRRTACGTSPSPAARSSRPSCRA